MAERSKAPESGVDHKILTNLVRKGEGSNPSVVIFFCLFRGHQDKKNHLGSQEFLALLQSDRPDRFDLCGRVIGKKNRGQIVYSMCTSLALIIIYTAQQQQHQTPRNINNFEK